MTRASLQENEVVASSPDVIFTFLSNYHDRHNSNYYHDHHHRDIPRRRHNYESHHNQY